MHAKGHRAGITLSSLLHYTLALNYVKCPPGLFNLQMLSVPLTTVAKQPPGSCYRPKYPYLISRSQRSEWLNDRCHRSRMRWEQEEVQESRGRVSFPSHPNPTAGTCLKALKERKEAFTPVICLSCISSCHAKLLPGGQSRGHRPALQALPREHSGGG